MPNRSDGVRTPRPKNSAHAAPSSRGPACRSRRLVRDVSHVLGDLPWLALGAHQHVHRRQRGAFSGTRRHMTTGLSSAQRAATIIRTGRYLSLATANTEARPWAAQLQYAWFLSPLSVVVGSHVAARHSRDIVETSRAAATISLLPASGQSLDGIQVAGSCRVLDCAELREKVSSFYQQMLPGTPDEESSGLTADQLSGDAPLRLYQLDIAEVWILDLDRWAREQVSGRRRLSAEAVESALHETLDESVPGS